MTTITHDLTITTTITYDPVVVPQDQWVPLGQSLYGEAAEDQHGQNLSLSADGLTLAVGAHLNNNAGTTAGRIMCTVTMKLHGVGINADKFSMDSPSTDLALR